jgi:hypothetical protein
MPIIGGSAMEFETKKQRNNYFMSVNTIINDGPAARPEWAKVPITFTEKDFRLKSTIHNDAMVIEVNIAGWVIGKVLVDNGSSADILFLKTFEKMNLSQHMLDPLEYPLQGFGGKPIKPVGKISLPVSFGDLENARTESLTFDVVDIYHPYLAIFGRGFMNKFDAVIRLQFLCMKMPSPKGVITVFGNQQEARNIEKGHAPGQTNVYQLKIADEKKETYEEAKQDKEKIEIAADGETKKVYLDDMPDRAVTIGAHLSVEEDRDLVQFLNNNKDVFAWSAKDLQGVDRDITEHALETAEKIPPKKQKLRKMSEEKVKAVEAEVQRLQDAQVIREVKYPVWLANTIPVKKKNGKWRMCVDFTDLNKACKKDDFPLERVDKIVDDAANSEMFSLLDMFSGYHQIRVRKEDEEKLVSSLPSEHLFRKNTRGAKERRMYILKNDSNSTSPADLEEHLGVCGRHSRQKCSKEIPHQRPGGNICEHESSKSEAESGEMCIRHSQGESSRMPSFNKRHRGNSTKSGLWWKCKIQFQ